MVALTGFVRNMNHIVIGTDDTEPIGLYLGLAGVGVVVVLNCACQLDGVEAPPGRPARRQGDRHPRHGLPSRRAASAGRVRREDISPFFWANGKVPTCDEWKTLAADEFKDYRLKVYGLVENPVELSLDELRAMGKKTQITLHHCIQGWSGIAEWGGLPHGGVDEAGSARSRMARAVVFYSFGEGVVQRGHRGRPVL